MIYLQPPLTLYGSVISLAAAHLLCAPIWQVFQQLNVIFKHKLFRSIFACCLIYEKPSRQSLLLKWHFALHVYKICDIPAEEDFFDPESDTDKADSETELEITPLSLREAFKPHLFMVITNKTNYFIKDDVHDEPLRCHPQALHWWSLPWLVGHVSCFSDLWNCSPSSSVCLSLGAHLERWY